MLISSCDGPEGIAAAACQAAVERPFFELVPSFLLYPMVLIATVATVVASQALISGAFSLTQQAVQLGFVPRVADHPHLGDDRGTDLRAERERRARGRLHRGRR